MINNLKELLKDHRIYHSEFQQDYFITGQAGTMYGQYKQALRELYSRTCGLRDMYWDREKLFVEIEEQKEIFETNENKFKASYALIKYKRKTMQLEEIDRTIRDKEREFKRFYQQANMLKAQLGELDEKRIAELEEELYTHKVKEMMVTDWLCNGRMSPQTYELLHSLPFKTKRQIIADTMDADDEKARLKQLGLIIQYEHEDRNYFNNFQELEMDVKKCLLET